MCKTLIQRWQQLLPQKIETYIYNALSDALIDSVKYQLVEDMLLVTQGWPSPSQVQVVIQVCIHIPCWYSIVQVANQ